MSDLFDKLAKEEESFLFQRFLSPVLPGRPIHVRIVGVRMRLAVRKEWRRGAARDYQGWGIFRPLDCKRCSYFREATLQERQAYLDLFPSVRLILVRKDDYGWYGIAANRGDSWFKIDGLVPIGLVEGAERFDTIVARYDGAGFWFDRVDGGRDPSIASGMRGQLGTAAHFKLGSPNCGYFDGVSMSPEEKEAYHIAFADHLESLKDRDEERIKDALESAGAVYKTYSDRGDVYSVTYSVDGHEHSSVFRKEDALGVVSAGICLSGGDSAFDASSLVATIREGHERGLIVREREHTADELAAIRRRYNVFDEQGERRGNRQQEDEDW